MPAAAAVHHHSRQQQSRFSNSITLDQKRNIRASILLTTTPPHHYLQWTCTKLAHFRASSPSRLQQQQRSTHLQPPWQLHVPAENTNPPHQNLDHHGSSRKHHHLPCDHDSASTISRRERNAAASFNHQICTSATTAPPSLQQKTRTRGVANGECINHPSVHQSRPPCIHHFTNFSSSSPCSRERERARTAAKTIAITTKTK